MANVRFLDQVSVSAFGNTGGGGGSSISSSYAETASFAQSGDGNFSGSFSGSFQGNGSQLTGVGAFPFSGSAVITGSLVISGSEFDGSTTPAVDKLQLQRYTFQTQKSYTGGPGSLPYNGQLIISGSDFDVLNPMLVLYRNSNPFSANVDEGMDLWAKGNMFVGGPSFFNGKISTIFSVTGSSVSGGGGEINLGNPNINLSANSSIGLFGHLTASAGVNISASATSTASFGTYLGDGSQLTGISTIPFPFSGSAVITGSLVISGSNETIGGISTQRNLNLVGGGIQLGGAIRLDPISDGTFNERLLFGSSASGFSIGRVIDSTLTIQGQTFQYGFCAFNMDMGTIPYSAVEIPQGILYTDRLKISASYSGDITSSQPQALLVQGSGSTVFSVVGSLGELFAIDDQLSGSLLVINDISGLPQFEVFSDGRTLIGADPRSLYTTATISATVAATSESIYSLSTSSYDGVFFDYTVTSASNARAGNIMSIWNGGNLVYTENTTTDIGSTAGVTFNVEISQSQAQLISVTDTAGWKIKTTIRSI